MMDPFKIRLSNLNDSSAIASLMTQLGYPTSPGQMTKRLEAILDKPGYRSFVADLNGEVVGFIGLGIELFYERDGLCGRLLALVVDERFRGAGIGEALVLAAEAWFADQGVHTVMLTSRHTRPDAHRFYKRMGYVNTGIRLAKELRDKS
jgi:GNAT superfamily N-acetyltransferase